MTRHSAHESVQKFRTPYIPLTDLDRGILARIAPRIMAGETRPFNHATGAYEGKHRFRLGSPITIRLCTKRGVQNGAPFVEVGGFRGVTLIEKPQENRLRALWQNGWWVEVQLAPFRRLLELATAAYSNPLPDDLTTIAIQAVLTPTELPS
jgi:hypothetical protein